jgi:hypothetical protein
VSDFKDFFVASVGAAAALIGLLFVAVSLGPEQLFGPDADAAKRGLAMATFIALGNVFFVSLAAIVPRNTAWIIAVVAGISILQILSARRTMSRIYPERRAWARFGLTSLAIYMLELVIAIRFATKTGRPDGIVYTVLGLYGYALAGSWSLLTARGTIK